MVDLETDCCDLEIVFRYFSLKKELVNGLHLPELRDYLGYLMNMRLPDKVALSRRLNGYLREEYRNEFLVC